MDYRTEDQVLALNLYQKKTTAGLQFAIQINLANDMEK